MKSLVCLLVGAMVAIGAPSPLVEVLDSAPSGFTVRSSVTIAESPARVYRNLVEVGSWWSSAHTFSGDAKNLSIRARAGGCFCEQLNRGGATRHLEVVHVVPGRLLRLRGGLGPLQEMAVSGVLTFTLTPSGESTEVELKYSVGGYRAGGMEPLAAPVDQVLAEQLTRLKNFSETGSP